MSISCVSATSQLPRSSPESQALLRNRYGRAAGRPAGIPTGKGARMVSDNGAEAGADTRGRQLWRQAPTAYKAGIVMATFGWFLSINFGRKSSRNGVVTSCSYVDIGQFGLAIALIIVAVLGPLANRRAGYPLPRGVAAGLSLAFVLAAAVMTARGFGWGADYCLTP
jgi:hypothetical protein